LTAIVSTSVVFTGLVGSTEPAVRSPLLGLLRGAVASTGGSEVKDLGDGLMVVYPSLGGALDGAVAMQQEIEQHNRKATVSLGVRIGLSSGDAVAEDGDFSGDPIVEAQALCAAASGGQILTTEVVHLSALRTAHRFTAVGAQQLHDVPDPIDVCELCWDPVTAVAEVPLPSRLALVPAGGMVGRELQRERLLHALKAVSAGEGHRVVLLSGEPGIGKTTLAGDVARRAHADGATVLHGRCDEDLGVPYQPFVEALGGYVANAPDIALSAIDDRRLSELGPLLPQVRRRTPTLAEAPATDPDAERYRLFGAVTAVLAEMAGAAPVVIVLDDLHWADKPTVLLLRHLVTTLDDAAVLLVGTYRDSDLTVDHALTEALAALSPGPAVDRISIGGLDDGGVIALLEGLAGHEMTDEGIELAHAVRRETGGNPFFAAEMLRHLADIGAIRQDGGRWVATVDLSRIGLPESVREVVGQRVLRLGDDVQHILTMASVIGRDFDVALLSRVAERDEAAVSDALEAAAGAQIVAVVEASADRYSFTHALFQHTLYDALSASRRARTHRRIGELLEVDCGDDPGERIGELAHHWMVATKPADEGKAADYARRAGRRALESLAPDEAIRWFTQAIELLDEDPHHDAHARLDVLIGRGDAQRQAGDPGYRETLLDAAAEATRLGDTERLVAAALANNRGRASRSGGVDEERIAMLEGALSAVGDADSRERAWLLATLGAELPFSMDLGRVRALATEAEAMARRLGDDGTLLRVLNLTYLSLWVPENLERSIAASQEAVTLAKRVGDPVARFWAALNRVYAMTSAADRAGIDAAIELALSMAEQIRQPFLTGWALQVRCPCVLLAGDAEEAERLAGDALQINLDSGQPDALAVFGANLAGIRLHQGRLEEILPLIAEAAADNPGLPGFQAANPLMLCECGRFDEARTLFDAARGADFHHAAYDYLWLPMTALWADTAAWLADVPAAGLLYERLAPFERQGITTSSTFLGTVGMYLARLAAVLGRDDDAQRHFEKADVQLRALDAPYWHARNQVDWAGFLITRAHDDDVNEARALLEEATRTAATHGCGAVERRASALVRSLSTGR
jgi:tetratricopeptide (TPR) repeat protein